MRNMSNIHNDVIAENINEYYDEIWNSLNIIEKTELLEQGGFILKHTSEQREWLETLGEKRQPEEVMKVFLSKDKVLAG